MAKVQNKDRLLKKFKSLPDDMRKGIRPALEAQAERITSLMRHLAPVLKKPHKGRNPGELRESIGWRYKEIPGKDMEVLISAGANSEDGPFYARFVEFGVREQMAGETRVTFNKKGKRRSRKSKRTVSGITAQPFFYPAFRALKRSAGSAVNKAAKTALKKNASK